MKVVVVTNYFASHGGGVERVAEEVIRFVAMNPDIHVQWFAADSAYAPPDLPSNVVCHAIPCFNFVEQKVGFPLPIWAISGFNRLARAIRACDVVHVHDYLYLSNIVAFLLAKRYGKPVLATQHTAYVPCESAVLTALLQALNAAIGRPLLRSADQAVFISDRTREYFSRQSRYQSPAVLQPNGVRTDRFRPLAGQRAEVRRRLSLPERGHVALFVGRFIEKKGLPLLREMAVATPEVQWIVAGWGPLRPEEWGLDNVRVVRDQEQSQLVPFYQTADALVLPSRGEGFPLVIQEAMACGTPVLTNIDTLAAIPGLEAMLHGESVTGPNVAQRWVDRLKRILAENTPEVRDRLARHAQQWSWARVAERYYAIFAGLNPAAAVPDRTPIPETAHFHKTSKLYGH